MLPTHSILKAEGGILRVKRFLIPVGFLAIFAATAFFLLRDFRSSVAIFRPPTEPAQLQIHRLDLSSSISPVGFEPGSRKIAVPNSEIGWFEQSSTPDREGVIFLVGHSHGVFSDLHHITVGDHLTMSLVSDTIGIITYEVYAIDILHRDDIDMRRHVLSSQDYDRELVLMTCIGEFDPSIDTYTHRLIVRARLFSVNH
jgi:LPXTG-site transpeptidase (sortase) family protein